MTLWSSKQNFNNNLSTQDSHQMIITHHKISQDNSAKIFTQKITILSFYSSFIHKDLLSKKIYTKFSRRVCLSIKYDIINIHSLHQFAKKSLRVRVFNNLIVFRSLMSNKLIMNYYMRCDNIPKISQIIFDKFMQKANMKTDQISNMKV